MIHIDTGRLRDEYTGTYDVHTYSNNLGKIEKYAYEIGYSSGVSVETEKSIFTLAGKPTFARSLSCVLGWYDDDEISPSVLRQIKEARKKSKGSFLISDPRVVRASILSVYEDIKYSRVRTEWSNEVYEADAKKITALLNKSLDWTIDDAKEWLRRNKFHVFDKLEDYRYSPENEDYLLTCDELIDPYWTPKR